MAIVGKQTVRLVGSCVIPEIVFISKTNSMYESDYLRRILWKWSEGHINARYGGSSTTNVRGLFMV